jgi:hypothetical protein
MPEDLDQPPHPLDIGFIQWHADFDVRPEAAGGEVRRA